MSPRPADRIRLLGVACRCRIGVPEWERRKPQTILLDVALETDTRAAGRSDALSDAIDYHALERALRATAEASRFKLLEALAEALAAEALRLCPKARAVAVAARKRPALMPKTAEVLVEIRRSRAR
jgi:dihydroneopterin aldolase